MRVTRVLVHLESGLGVSTPAAPCLIQPAVPSVISFLKDVSHTTAILWEHRCQVFETLHHLKLHTLLMDLCFPLSDDVHHCFGILQTIQDFDAPTDALQSSLWSPDCLSGLLHLTEASLRCSDQMWRSFGVRNICLTCSSSLFALLPHPYTHTTRC